MPPEGLTFLCSLGGNEQNGSKNAPFDGSAENCQNAGFLFFYCFIAEVPMNLSLSSRKKLDLQY